MSNVFVVLTANGHPMIKADGSVVRVTIQNFCQMAVAQCGIRLLRVACVLAVGINGGGQAVYGAINGRCTRLGMFSDEKD